KRLKAPKEFEQLAKIVSEFHLHLHKIEELKPKTIVKVLEKTDSIRKPERFEKFLVACEADFRGRTGFEKRPYPQIDLMRKAFEAFKSVSSKDIVDAGFEGKQIGEQMYSERVRVVAKLFKGN
ncbi:MAG: multifunctional CCA tRNA nucleotidyl transferase/2'3'-cyclic phosphodiesterase/2'nucleotidase/phosphatase, partial [Kangiellaceae bacterium]